MLIKTLKLNYFGQFHDLEVELKPGINVIFGENEAGKSTIHTFIKGMLFGLDRLRGRASNNALYSKYLPWNYPGAFNGSMDITIQDKEYRLSRNFHSNNKAFTIIDLETGREIKLSEGNIRDLIPELTEATFKNTISVEQLKVHTDADLAIQLRNYITNLSITKDNEVNVSKAISFLMSQRKKLEAEKNTSAQKSLQLQIEEGISREERIDSLIIQLNELRKEEKELKQKKEANTEACEDEETKRIEQFPAILEKYQSYQELTKQINAIELQYDQLKEKLVKCENDANKLETIKEQIKEIEELDLVHKEHEKMQKEQINKHMGMQTRERKRNIFYSIATVIVIALSTLYFTGISMFGLAFVGLGILMGCIMYLWLTRKSNMKQKQYDGKLKEYHLIIKSCIDRANKIMEEHGVITPSELGVTYDRLLKSYYSLEHCKEQENVFEHRLNELEDSRDQIYDNIMKYMQYFIRYDTLDDTAMEELKQEICARKSRRLLREKDLEKNYEGCVLRMEKICWELSNLEGNEDALIKNKVKYAELEQKQKDITLEVEALKLALQTIEQISIDIHDTFGRQLNQTLSNIISEVTKHKYGNIKVDEKLDIKVDCNAEFVTLDKLSAGTVDQVYFALRLAVADLLLGKNEMPLLLDDSFVLYDDKRVKSALMQIKDRRQVILFSCHKREKELLKECNIPYHLVTLK